jgi:hypothetical protein
MFVTSIARVGRAEDVRRRSYRVASFVVSGFVFRLFRIAVAVLKYSAISV